MPRHPSPGALRSSSGAFDLPSIITGVVVVGILTVGVLAVIFGVIPFVQNNGAKQDLMAINTAQGVTYAKHDQRYKDLDGLVDAGLISGMNPEKTEVTTSNEGKGFRAVVTSGTGQKWFITHENSVPRELKDEDASAGGVSWTGEWCSPDTSVGKQGRATYNAFMDPDSLEYLKLMLGGPADMDVAMAWFGRHSDALNPGGGGGAEGAALQDLSGLVNEALFEAINVFSAAPTNDEEWDLFHASFVRELDVAFGNFCGSYGGPMPYSMEEHPQRQEAWIDRVHGLTGSTEPITLGFTLEFGGAESFEVTARGAEQIPGYESQSTEFSTIDGEPYWEISLLPGSSGWGNSTDEYPLAVTVSRPDSGKEISRQWAAKVNPTHLKILPMSGWKPTAYGDTWDKVIRHTNSSFQHVYYQVHKFDSAEGSGVNYYDNLEVVRDHVVEETGETKVTGMYPNPLGIQPVGTMGFDTEKLGVGSVTIDRTVMDAASFARVSHEFKLTITDASPVPAPALKARDITPTDREDAKWYVIDIEDEYHKSDYSVTSISYGGKTFGPSEVGYQWFEIVPDVHMQLLTYSGEHTPELQSGGTYLVTFNIFDYRKPGSGAASVPETAEVTVTYGPTGKSTTVQLPIPALGPR